jgi:CelD/BcsL family acetyltransferase involved in cellulose biosynthesis
MIAVQVIEGVGELAAITNAWIDLWERCPAATPFQRPEWLLPWCRTFAPNGVRVVVVRAEDRVVGVLPLAVDGRATRLLGEGISDYLDALVDSGWEPDVLGCFSAEITNWDRCEMAALPASSPLLRMSALPGFRDAVTPDDVCPVLSLDGGLERALPKEMARNLRRARARAEEVGRLGLVTADADNRAELLEALFALHGARWGDGGVLGDAKVRAFHREMSEAMLAAGLLRLHGVTLDERIVAVVYGFAARDVLYLYLQGYDPADAELSPGTLAVGAAIAESAREGARAVDMLRGREGYKYRFGARDQGTFRRVIEKA